MGWSGSDAVGKRFASTPTTPHHIATQFHHITHVTSHIFPLSISPPFLLSSGVILQDTAAIEQVQSVSRWPLGNNEDVFNTKYPDYVKLKRRALKAAPDFPDRYPAVSPPSSPSSATSSPSGSSSISLDCNETSYENKT